MFFFFKQKTAYEMRISDWSSDVCSSDLDAHAPRVAFDLQDPRVLRPRLQQHLAHVLRVVLDRRSHRVDARHPLTVLAHRRSLATGSLILTRINAENSRSERMGHKIGRAHV